MTAVDDFLGVAPSWRTLAACRGMNPDLFFPERGASTKEVKEICASCPVRVDCLAQAISTAEHHGIWGGLSERQRRQASRGMRLRRSRPLPPATSVRAQQQRERRAKRAAESTTQPDLAPDAVEKVLQILGYIEKRFT